MRIEPVVFNIFTIDEVKVINKEIGKVIKKEEPSNQSSNVTKKGDFSVLQLSPLVGILEPWLREIQKINKCVYGYDIYFDFHLEPLNYNVYGVGDGYEWHVDANKNTVYDIKLTCLLNLSEDLFYEGGEFHVTTGNEKTTFTPGMGLVLNSTFAHKVTPITKGERRTLTYWAEGPVWR